MPIYICWRRSFRELVAFSKRTVCFCGKFTVFSALNAIYVGRAPLNPYIVLFRLSSYFVFFSLSLIRLLALFFVTLHSYITIAVVLYRSLSRYSSNTVDFVARPCCCEILILLTTKYISWWWVKESLVRIIGKWRTFKEIEMRKKNVTVAATVEEGGILVYVCYYH